MERELKGQGLAQGHDRLFARLESCGLPKDVIRTLFSRHTLVRYPKGSPLFDKGSPADVVFVVLSGIVKIYCARADSAPCPPEIPRKQKRFCKRRDPSGVSRWRDLIAA